jgi:serine/threonine-protein kinase
MATSARGQRVYGFGDFRLEPGRRLLIGVDGKPVSLSPKAHDTLAYLVEHAGAVVEKDELLQAVWPHTAVEENNLTQNISLLRRALGDGRGEHRYIATVPGRGYQFVAGVQSAVSDSSPNGSDSVISIAVLPFVNVNDSSDCEYFGDGLTEELTDAFSRLARVRVVARTSAFSFKGKRADVREIARQLGASLVLEGSVRRSGDRLRISVRLIDALDGYQMWSESYDREIENHDAFAVQDDITPSVVDALKLKLPGAEKSPAPKPAASEVRSRGLYLKGRFYSFRMTRSGIDTGIPCFEEAIARNPSYALAQVGLAHAYRMFGLSLDMPTSEIGPKAKAAALKAIEIDENLAEAHAVLAFNILWYEWAWKAAEKHFRRAMELNPNSADTLWMHAHLQSNLGRHNEALVEIRRARELDPLSGLINAMEGQLLLHAGRSDEAMASLREAIELDPKSRVAHIFAASAYIEKGLFKEAIAEAIASRALTPSNSQHVAIESFANARLGRRAEAHHGLETLLQLSRERYVPASNIALAYMGLGEHNAALTWLDRGFEERDPRMAFLKVEPKWWALHGNPRYDRLLDQLKLGVR